MPTIERELAGLPASFAAADGPRRGTVLLVHGFLGHHRQFDGWLPVLSGADFDAHALSLRGRLGAAPANPAAVRLDDYVEDVARALTELPAGTTLIGHSLGALVAAKAAARDGRPRALVLLAPGPERHYVPAPGLLPALPWMMPRVLLGRAMRPPLWVVRQIALNRIPEAEQAPLHAGMVADSGRAYRTFLLGAGVDKSRIHGPVLVLAGAEDRVVPARVARAMARRLGAECRVLPGHAHWLLSEPGWEAIAAQVVDWLERSAPAAS